MSGGLELISFSELLTKLDEVGSVQVELIKEILNRYFNKKLTEDEYQEFYQLQIRKASQIADSFSSCSKQEFIKGAEVISDELYNENR